MQEIALFTFKNNPANNLLYAGDGAEAPGLIFGEGKYAGRAPENKLKVILPDIKMPKKNGIEVLRCIKADEHTRKIPVVILTSSEEDPDIKTCCAPGINSYVVKPAELDSFYKALSQPSLCWMIVNQLRLSFGPTQES